MFWKDYVSLSEYACLYRVDVSFAPVRMGTHGGNLQGGVRLGSMYM